MVGKGKLRPSPSASATAFAPGTVKKGNDGNKYVIVVASNGVPRWQRSMPAGKMKVALKKTGGVKKLAMKKLAVKKPTLAMKVPPAEKKKLEAKPIHPNMLKEQAAKDVCRRLTKGQLRIGDLGKSPDTKGFMLLRDFAKKFMSNPANYKKFQKAYCSPAMECSDDVADNIPARDPVLTTIAYLPAEIVDGMKVDARFILFSDEKDKKFYSLGLLDGYYRGDSANQFYYDFLVKKKYKPSEISAKLKGPNYKIMEDLMVKQYGAAMLMEEQENA